MTLSVYVTNFVIPPPVPRTLMGCEPAGVESEVYTVMVDVQTELGLQLDGLNEHDAPDGRFAHESETAVEAPFTRVKVAVAEALDI